MKNYKNISIDIETLATTSDAVVLSIGACLFSTKEGKVDMDNTFKVKLDPNKQYQRKRCPNTLAFWANQHPNVIKSTFNGTLRPHEALQALCDWVPTGVKTVWASGLTFYISILQHMFLEQGMKEPWPYYAPQELRTLRLIADKAGVKKYQRIGEGLAHDCLEDAIDQSKSIIYYHKALELV